MPSALETLVKILKHEQETGYQDKAVIGGLATFASNWIPDARAQAKKPEHHTLIDELAGVIATYHDLNVEPDRREAIKYMLGRIMGRIPSPNGTVTATPPAAQAQPQAQPQKPQQERQERQRYEDRREERREQPREQRQSPPAQQQPQQARHHDAPIEREHIEHIEPAAEALRSSDYIEVEEVVITYQETVIISGYVTEEAPEIKSQAEDHGERQAERQAESEQEAEQPPAPQPRQYRESLASGFERPDPESRERFGEGLTPNKPKNEALTPARRKRDNYVREQSERAARAVKQPLTVLNGIGPKNAEKLAELDLFTVEDVLFNLPRRYDDYTQMPPLAKLLPGMTVTALGEVRSVGVFKGKRGQEIINVTLGDGTGTLTATFFGAPWLRTVFERGMQIALRGKVELFLGKPTMSQPEWEPVERDALYNPMILPVYSLSRNTKQNLLRRAASAALDLCAEFYPDPMPESVLERMDLPDLGWALMQLHFPESMQALELAQRRLSFDELMLLQLGVLQNRREWQSQPAQAISVADDWYDAFAGALPYPLTGAQQRSIMAVREDIAKPIPMNRLLQGDVGAGKTVVALASMLMAVQAGMQAAIMAPTGILAEQHYKSITRMLAQMPGGEELNVQLLTSSSSAQQRRDTLWYLGEGKVNILVGTHAILEDDVNFQQLGLVVIDEQHRFGVQQRGKLRGKGVNPHVLVMTATPIPRTLALTMYADLDLSVLDEMPPGRTPIQTRVLTPRERERSYGFIESQIEKGRQAFIVYPLVEASESESLEHVPSAVEEFQRLSEKVFPKRRLGLLHGKMTPAEKDAAMGAFSRGETDVLVCTAVVEVGIDVPNSTVMLIEGANRFGLAQLHQFRGRVGRGEHASYCLLIPDDGDAENPRLKAMEETTDGFKLAELDWQMRGAGDLLGTRQSGGVARLGEHMDVKLVSEAQLEARTIYEEDPALMQSEHVALREKLLQRFALNTETTDVS
ncbi:MAG: ATP-dependent DNA helicase RecG [Anaerolineae bacterium]|nr:ATP-dependent DNA helicase RecG [Anaerolineae bacterium]